jgi:hypothetical protein
MNMDNFSDNILDESTYVDFPAEKIKIKGSSMIFKSNKMELEVEQNLELSEPKKKKIVVPKKINLKVYKNSLF